MFEEFFNDCGILDPEQLSDEQSENIKSSLKKRLADGDHPQAERQTKEEKIMKASSKIRTLMLAATVAAAGAMSLIVSANTVPISDVVIPKNEKPAAEKISIPDNRDAAAEQFDEFYKNGLTGALEGTLNTGGYTVEDYINAYDEANAETDRTYKDAEPDEEIDKYIAIRERELNKYIDEKNKHTIRINEPSYDKPVYYTYRLDLSNENTVMDGDVITVGRWEYEDAMARNDPESGEHFGTGWMSALAEEYTVNNRKMLGSGIALAHEDPFTNIDGSIGWSRSWCQIKYVDGEGWVYNGTRCNDRLVEAIEDGIATYGSNFTVWY